MLLLLLRGSGSAPVADVNATSSPTVSAKYTSAPAVSDG